MWPSAYLRTVTCKHKRNDREIIKKISTINQMKTLSNEIMRNWLQNNASDFSRMAESYSEKNISHYEIDCSQLDNIFIHQDIRQSEHFKKTFCELEKIEKNPCVYYFEIISDISSQTIVNSLVNSDGGGTKPAIKKKYPLESNILYVGKVKSVVWGRLIAHMGFHTHKINPGIQSVAHGLQLRNWAKELNIHLRFHVHTFEPEFAEYMDLIERKLAKELNPIIGKH